jgi:hypothetical protein
MGAIQDRTREHLGTSDKLIMANRRELMQAINSVESGGTAPGVALADVALQRTGPDTVDGIAPAGTWATWWRDQAQAKHAACPWMASAQPAKDTA